MIEISILCFVVGAVILVIWLGVNFMSSVRTAPLLAQDCQIRHNASFFRLWDDNELHSITFEHDMNEQLMMATQVMHDQAVQNQMIMDEQVRLNDPYQNPGQDIVADETYHGIDHGSGMMCNDIESRTIDDYSMDGMDAMDFSSDFAMDF